VKTIATIVRAAWQLVLLAAAILYAIT